MLATTLATFALALAPGHAADNYCADLTVQTPYSAPQALPLAAITAQPRWNADHDRKLYVSPGNGVAVWDGTRIVNRTDRTIWVTCLGPGLEG